MPVTKIKTSWVSGNLHYKDSNANEQLVLRDGGDGVALSADTTLTAADHGKTFFIDTADLVITLPATVNGLRYTFCMVAAGLSASTGLSISPNANDAINGNALTSVNDKDLINSGATDAEGDTVTLVGDGLDGWYITSVVGTWAKEG